MSVGMKDVAARCGVSIKTVSNVINNVPNMSGETRKRVLAAIRDLNYVPNIQARSLVMKQRGAKSQLGYRIGCILPAGVGKYDDSYYTVIFKGIEEELLVQGHQLAFIDSASNLELNPLRMNWLLSDENTDAIISFVGPDGAIFDRFSQLPLVLIGSVSGYESVGVDKTGGMTALLDHLCQLGHQDIAYLGRFDDDRFRSFSFELMQRGIQPNQAWLKECRFSFDSGKQAAQDLFQQSVPMPTALIGACDYIAIGAMHAALESGLQVPADLAIAGFDNRPESQLLYPPLTTVDINLEGIGRMAVRSVLERIKAPHEDTASHVLSSRLVIRQSTGNR